MENENSNRSLISLVFVAAGFLVFLTVSILFQTLAGAVGFVARAREIELLRHGLPIGLALIAFAVLNFHPKIQAWADEVVTEVKKVVWPSKNDTIGMTVVVCVMVLVAGMAFGVFDFVASRLIEIFVKI